MPHFKRVTGFFEVGTAYVDIAFDEPKLFQYLYLSADRGYFSEGFDTLITAREHSDFVEQVAISLCISEEKAVFFCKNMKMYTHGLASYIASGLVKVTKDEVILMMRQASEGFLRQLNAGMPPTEGEENDAD